MPNPLTEQTQFSKDPRGCSILLDNLLNSYTYDIASRESSSLHNKDSMDDLCCARLDVFLQAYGQNKEYEVLLPYILKYVSNPDYVPPVVLPIDADKLPASK